MNTLTDLLLGVGQPRVSHFPDLCTLLYTYLSTLDYWTKIVYYLFTQTSPVAHTSALTPTYIKSQKLPNWPISKELGLGRMLLPHWKLLFTMFLSSNHNEIFITIVLKCVFLWISLLFYYYDAGELVLTDEDKMKAWAEHYTVETLYNTVNFCWNTHKRHSIARPKGRGMGCLLWVQRATYCVDLSILSSIKYLL